MPTKPSPAPTPKRSLTPLIIIGIIILVSMASLTSWKIYHSHEVAVDKARFAQAEKDVNELSKQIITSVGQPAKTQTEKFCSRPNLKYEEGPLSCDIKWTGYYGVENPAKASELQANVQRIYSNKWSDSTFKSLSNDSSEKFRDLDPDNTTLDGDDLRIIGQSMGYTQMNCSILTTFYLESKPPYGGPVGVFGTKYVEVFDLDCTGRAKIEHFPMKS